VKTVEVRTQEQLEAALKLPETCISLVEGSYDLVTKGEEAPLLWVSSGVELRVEAWGNSQPWITAWGNSQPWITARGNSQPRVTARESSQPRVVAWESGQPRVEAWGDSQPRIKACDRSQPRVEARENSQPRVTACDNSQPRIDAWHSSQPRVEAWGNSQPRITAWGDSQPRVEACDSSQPRVDARGNGKPYVEAFAFCQLSVRGSVTARCSPKVSVLIEGEGAKVIGGKKTRKTAFKGGRAWCHHYGVPIRRGKVVLYKVVDGNLRSSQGTAYPIGGTVESDGWDELECSSGLHFSPCVAMTNGFAVDDWPKRRYIACEVAVKDLLVFPNGSFPHKAKAPSCKVLYEVDEDGVRM
jgi:hypothetical protein